MKTIKAMIAVVALLVLFTQPQDNVSVTGFVMWVAVMCSAMAYLAYWLKK